MKEMWSKIVKLIDVKTIISLIVVGVFCKMSLDGQIDAGQFSIVAVTVINYFFDYQRSKIAKESEKQVHTSTDLKEGE